MIKPKQWSGSLGLTINKLGSAKTMGHIDKIGESILSQHWSWEAMYTQRL